MEKGVVQVVTLTQVETIVLVLLGIVLSLVLPVAVRTLQQAKLEAKDEPATLGARIAAAWRRYGGNKYLWIFLSAALVSIVLVFLLELVFYTARDAALAGFAWESLVNKLFRTPEGS